MDALWAWVLEVSSQLLIPDWRELIALLPLGVLGLILLWGAWTVVRFATVGPARRVPARVTPVAPRGLHMPGPSASPILAAIGTALLLAGLVFGGLVAGLGIVAIVLALLFWGREALREFDHLGAPSSDLPALAHAGPPPGVHVPGPSFRPLLGALATSGLLAGLVFGGAILAAGVLFLAVALLGWLRDAKAEYVETVRADTTGHLENIPAPRWPTGIVAVFGILFALAILVQAGILPPSRDGATGGGGGEPSPGASGEPTLEPGTLSVTAKGVTYLQKTLEVTAGEAFTIHFVNEDPVSVPHDVDIRAADGTTVIADQATIEGGKSVDYRYDALEPGEYRFICSLHPVPSMTGTLVVK